MSAFLVRGGKPLKGTVKIEGAKNAILPIMAATLLNNGSNVIKGVAELDDVFLMIDILKSFGAEVSYDKNRLEIDNKNIKFKELSPELMRKMRATIFLMGPLLASFKCARLSYPGGCAIGPRPINWHLKNLSEMGVNIDKKHGIIEADVDELKGADLHLEFPSVGVTENIMMAATRAKGVTTINNAAREPEIVDLQNFLNQMGARVFGAGTDQIRIHGVDSLHSTNYRVIPDRIEAGTFIILAAITEGKVTVKNVIPEHLAALISKMKESGVDISIHEDQIIVKGAKQYEAIDVKTQPYPGFPTDLQPQIVAMLTLAKGTSVVSENIFENRMKHVEELNRMGGNIVVEGHTAIIKGVEELTGAAVEATDLRAGAALIIAGLAGKGTTEIEEIKHIERGYSNIENKIRNLGGIIKKIK